MRERESVLAIQRILSRSAELSKEMISNRDAYVLGPVES